MNEFLDSLKCLINGETDGLQQVARFAKRIKLTGKSALVKHIKQVYDPKSSTVYVLPLRPKFPN